MKIIFIGASLTEGVYGGNFVEGVAKKLPQHEIINLGTGGLTINRLLDRLDTVIELRPDVVVIMAGSNDAIAYSQPDTRSYYKSVQKIPNGFFTPDEFSRHFRELITQLQLEFIQPLVVLAPLEYNPDVVAAAELFNSIMAEVAQDFNLPVLDLATPFIPDDIPDRPSLGMKYILLIGERHGTDWDDYENEQRQGGYTYTFDGIHIPPAVAEKFADIIADFLRETLA
jgi:lysophospholipase L1-like esterase